MRYLLSIESSCDDTSAAIIGDGKVLSNVIATQEVHKNYGGVVPELASREHIQKIIPVVQSALDKAGINQRDLSAVAVTRGPGLLGSLIVGVTFAKSLAQGLNIPIIEVQHMHAHVLANFAEEPKPSFPFICLTVSGGHTQLVKVTDPTEMTILGQTIDDAAGEAFDKSGKMMGLPYPAGPHIDKLAKEGEVKYEFPFSRVGDFDFSFSGLKTAILYFLRNQMKEDDQFIKREMNHICASIQENICTTLINKLEKAAISANITSLAMAGGVSANSRLRSMFTEMCEKNGFTGHIPHISYCTDNAGMIGIAAWYKFLENDFSDLGMTPEPRMAF